MSAAKALDAITQSPKQQSSTVHQSDESQELFPVSSSYYSIFSVGTKTAMITMIRRRQWGMVMGTMSEMLRSNTRGILVVSNRIRTKTPGVNEIKPLSTKNVKRHNRNSIYSVKILIFLFLFFIYRFFAFSFCN
jgi:hypothetical protein